MSALELMTVARNSAMVAKLSKLMGYIVDRDNALEELKEKLGDQMTFEVEEAVLEVKHLNYAYEPKLDQQDENVLEKAVEAEGQKQVWEIPCSYWD